MELSTNGRSVVFCKTVMHFYGDLKIGNEIVLLVLEYLPSNIGPILWLMSADKEFSTILQSNLANGFILLLYPGPFGRQTDR